MDKNQDKKNDKQSGGITHKKDLNAGSGAFNQGSEQDPDYDKGTKVSDKEKRTGNPLTNKEGNEENTETPTP
jgi:hypothetical protein